MSSDINECEAIPGLCEGGKCLNSPGSFTCECPEGQARDPETNECKDKDECKEEGICADGRCINTIGGYYCHCNPGFIQSQDRKFCIGNSIIITRILSDVVIKYYDKSPVKVLDHL